jgi:hypothetical protein
MANLDTPKTPGLLSLKPQEGGPGPRVFNIKDGQAWLHALAQNVGSHPVARFQTQEDADALTFTTEGGSKFSFTPAGSEDEFFAQRAALVRAFEEEVGRPPAYEGGTEADDTFWDVLAAIQDAYQGPTLDPDAVIGGLS